MKFNIDVQRKIVADVIHKYEVEADSYEEAVLKLNSLPDNGYILEDKSYGIELKDTILMDEYSYISKDTTLEGVEYKKIGGNDLTQFQKNSKIENKKWMIDILEKI